MFIEVKDMEYIFHIPEPWYIDHFIFSEKLKQLDVYAKYRKKALFACSSCGKEAQPIYDITDRNRTWRHLNFLEYPCYIHAEVPRTQCTHCQSIKRVDIPSSVSFS